MLRSKVKRIIQTAIESCYPGLSSSDFNLDEPPPEIDADLSSNVAFILSRKVLASPISVAHFLAEKIQKGEVIKKIGVSQNGFLNLTLREEELQKVVIKTCLEKENLGKEIHSGAERTLIEFVSANPTGPLHIGHGRGAALGDSLARIYRQCGYPVETEYYINDVGVQMKVLADSVRTKFLHLKGESETASPENGYKGKYIEEIARKMAADQRDDFSQFPKEFLLKEIRKDLESFFISFDHWFYESSLVHDQKVEKILELLRSKNALKEKEGALWFVPEKENGKDGELDKERVLRKSDGQWTYFASDIAYHKDKFERGFNRLIDIWGHDHHGYLPRLESAISTIGLPKTALKVILYQLVSLKRSGKRVSMSTRRGEFITLREILDEVGSNACRFFFALRSPSSQLEFDLDLAKKESNENPVYYVQYVYARISSIFREAEKREIQIPILKILTKKNSSEKKEEILLTLLKEKEERELMKKIGFFVDTLKTSLQISSPHLLAEYLIDLSTKFHRFYTVHRVLDAESQIREARLVLLHAVQIIVKLGLSLLGVTVSEKM